MPKGKRIHRSKEIAKSKAALSLACIEIQLEWHKQKYNEANSVTQSSKKGHMIVWRNIFFVVQKTLARLHEFYGLFKILQVHQGNCVRLIVKSPKELGFQVRFRKSQPDCFRCEMSICMDSIRIHPSIAWYTIWVSIIKFVTQVNRLQKQLYHHRNTAWMA